MLIRLCFFYLFIASGVVFAGSITQHTFPSTTLDRDYAYNLYLPDGYDTSKQDYPVLYLLHGSGGNETDYPIKGTLKQTADKLISEGSIPPAVIVSPGSKSWWVDGHNEKAKTAFFNDLIPHIENNLRVIPNRSGRVIAGHSAGGYGALNFVLQHPEQFAAAAILSPAVYIPYPPAHSSAYQDPTFVGSDGAFDKALWDELIYSRHMDDYKSQSIVVPVYINSGDHDVFDIAYHAAVLYQALREHQPELVEFRVVDGDHEWDVWRDTLPEAMEYLFRFTSPPLLNIGGSASGFL